MPERTMIGLLAAKLHASAADPVPTALANSLEVMDGQVSFNVQSTPVKRKNLDGGLQKVAGMPSALPQITLKFKTPLRGNRTNGTADDISAGSIAQAIEIDPLFQGCDFAATYTAESGSGTRDGNVIYAHTDPSDEGVKVAFYFWTKQKKHSIQQAKGTFQVVAEAGKIPYIEWTFSGLYVAPADATFPTDAAFEDTRPPLVKGCGVVTIGSYTPVITRLDLSVNNVVSRRLDIAATDGIKGFIITDYAPSGSIDPEAVTEATNPFWANWKADAVKTLTVAIGADTGNKCQITAVTQAIDVNYGEREGLRTHNKQFEVVRENMNDAQNAALQIKFY
jgi:hypothetical protein